MASGSVTGNFSVAGTLTVATPTNSTDAASKGYVDTAVANVIDSAPAALDTLNELAAALNDDASFATTVTTALAGKLALAGGTGCARSSAWPGWACKRQGTNRP